MIIDEFIYCFALIQVDEVASQKEAVEQQLNEVLAAQVKSINQPIYVVSN